VFKLAALALPIKANPSNQHIVMVRPVYLGILKEIYVSQAFRTDVNNFGCAEATV
jgi:hypothetical protein